MSQSEFPRHLVDELDRLLVEIRKASDQIEALAVRARDLAVFLKRAVREDSGNDRSMAERERSIRQADTAIEREAQREVERRERSIDDGRIVPLGVEPNGLWGVKYLPILKFDGNGALVWRTQPFDDEPAMHRRYISPECAVGQVREIMTEIDHATDFAPYIRVDLNGAAWGPVYLFRPSPADQGGAPDFVFDTLRAQHDADGRNIYPTGDDLRSAHDVRFSGGVVLPKDMPAEERAATIQDIAELSGREFRTPLDDPDFVDPHEQGFDMPSAGETISDASGRKPPETKRSFDDGFFFIPTAAGLQDLRDRRSPGGLVIRAGMPPEKRAKVISDIAELCGLSREATEKQIADFFNDLAHPNLPPDHPLNHPMNPVDGGVVHEVGPFVASDVKIFIGEENDPLVGATIEHPSGPAPSADAQDTKHAGFFVRDMKAADRGEEQWIDAGDLPADAFEKPLIFGVDMADGGSTVVRATEKDGGLVILSVDVAPEAGHDADASGVATEQEIPAGHSGVDDTGADEEQSPPADSSAPVDQPLAPDAGNAEPLTPFHPFGSVVDPGVLFIGKPGDSIDRAPAEPPKSLRQIADRFYREAPKPTDEALKAGQQDREELDRLYGARNEKLHDEVMNLWSTTMLTEMQIAKRLGIVKAVVTAIIQIARADGDDRVNRKTFKSSVKPKPQQESEMPPKGTSATPPHRPFIASTGIVQERNAMPPAHHKHISTGICVVDLETNRIYGKTGYWTTSAEVARTVAKLNKGQMFAAELIQQDCGWPTMDHLRRATTTMIERLRDCSIELINLPVGMKLNAIDPGKH